MSLALPRARAAAEAPTETVLVLEDDAAVRALLARTLEGLGYSVHLAATGAEALAIADAHPDAIDVILSDVVLPGISGPETVRRILSSPGRPPAVLFMSGYTDHPALRDGTVQTSHFITKPLTRGAIAHKLRAVIDGH